MKRFGLIISCCLLFLFSPAQEMDIKDLTGLLYMNQVKLENHLQKKGYRRNVYEDNGDMGICFVKEVKAKKKPASIRTFHIIGNEYGYDLAYRTSCPKEDSTLKTQINSLGFNTNSKGGNEPVLYQKQGLRIEHFTQKQDSTDFFVVKASKKELPKRKDIFGAEDLLKLDAHEYLVEVFGKENVKTDVFYFTEAETNKCSILFPNSTKEAIFIWDDETNMKDLSFIVIGGSLKPKVNTGSVNQVAQNSWVSNQGIYCGMSLRELEKLNQAPVRFYNWHTESAGYLAPNNKGSIDFNRIGLMFNCLNCNYLEVAKTQVAESGKALEQNQKVYVTTLIILPEKKSTDTRVQGKY